MKNARVTRFGRTVSCLLASAIAVIVAVSPAAVRAGADRSDRDDRGQRDDDRDWDRFHFDQPDKQIRHVVVIFQENVSFDHYFATYPHAANTDGQTFTSKAGTPLVNGLFSGGLLDHNPNTWNVPPVQSAQPFRLSSAQGATCDQGHGYQQEQQSFNAGAMNRFPDTVGVGGPPCIDYGKGKALVMGYYDGNTVTALWNYAQNFAMNDNSYSTTFGPSTPGAVNLISGQTHGAMLAPDLAGRFGSASGNVTAIDGAGIGAVIGDPRPSPALDNCTLPSPAAPSAARTYIEMIGPNVGDLLNKHHITWGWFQGGFKPAAAPTPPLANTPGGTGPIVCGSAPECPGLELCTDYIPHHEPFQYYLQTANPKHLPPSSVSMIGRTDQANHQYRSAGFLERTARRSSPRRQLPQSGCVPGRPRRVLRSAR